MRFHRPPRAGDAECGAVQFYRHLGIGEVFQLLTGFLKFSSRLLDRLVRVALLGLRGEPGDAKFQLRVLKLPLLFAQLLGNLLRLGRGLLSLLFPLIGLRRFRPGYPLLLARCHWGFL